MKKIYPVKNRSPQGDRSRSSSMRAASNGIYSDYAATTPLDPAVRRAMMPYFGARFGNPGSLHSFGQEAMAAVDLGREKVARSLGLDILKGFREIIFTGSATEANNLALRAAVKEFKIQFVDWQRKYKNVRVIISAIEHDSVLETARDLERDGAELVILPVDKKGIVDLELFKENLSENTAIVSVMFANNETGAVQPIADISKIIREFRGLNKFPLFHSDAVQAFQYLDCSPEKSGIDLLTLSAHKICGPKGIGALYVRSGIFEKPLPIIAGGGQEFGWRSGTENAALIAGFGKAAELAAIKREGEKARMGTIRDYFLRELKKIFPQSEINGSASSLPNILNVFFPGCSAEELLIKLDMAGAAVSAGSACSARSTKISHVLKAMALPEKRIKSSLRFSFGRFTSDKEIRSLILILKNIFRQ